MNERTASSLLVASVCVATVTIGVARGQSNIDSAHKFAWGENIGWTNWHYANEGTDGVVVDATYLGGFVWAENAGWINLGDGGPTDGVHYGNEDGADFGVNIDENEGLFGLGWGENIGWVNFDTRGKDDERARFDCDDMRLRGFVWSENVGWVNLDDDIHYLAGAFDEACPTVCGDADDDGDVDVVDFESFAFCLAGGGPNDPVPPLCRGFDCDGDLDVDLEDFGAFQGSFSG